MTGVADKHARLREIIAGYGSAAVAYSGGVDSALVARVAHEVLGDRAVAFTVVSAFLPAEELRFAKDLAREIGIRHECIELPVVDGSRMMENTAERCYFCKFSDYGAIRNAAAAQEVGVVCDGTQADDAADPDRPGFKALGPMGIRSPLLEAGITKAELRSIAREIGLRAYDKPSAACLASRFPTGEQITVAGLKKVEDAEAALHLMGFRQLRVRIVPGQNAHVARVEFDSEGLARSADASVLAAVDAAVRRAGFSDVTVDPRGYRTGAANEAAAAR